MARNPHLAVFLFVDSDAGDLATFVGALTSRYASEYEIRAAAKRCSRTSKALAFTPTNSASKE